MRTIFALLIGFSMNAFAMDAAQPNQAKDAPKVQCYSGDSEKFYNVGEKATIAGVSVICELTADQKSGKWMSVKQAK